MPFSFTLLGPDAVLIMITAIMAILLLRRIFGHHSSH